jgi:hypothetical protein
VARDVGLRTKELYDALAELRDIKQQATELGARIAKAGMGNDVAELSKALTERLVALEGELTQLQGEGGQDALNFPGRLDNQFVTLYGFVSGSDGRPGKGAYDRLEELKPQLSKRLTEFKQVIDTYVAKFNDLVRSKGVAPIILGSGVRARPASQPQ